MHAKIHTATSVPCVHFQFSFHRDGEVTHTHEHPKKSWLFFWCIFSKSKNFSTTQVSLFLSLAALFKKKQTPSTSLPPAPPNVSSPVKFINAFSIEEEEEEKEEKKASNFQSCRLLFYTHTHKERSEKKEQNREKKSCTLK